MTKRKATLPNDYERMIPEYHKGSIIYGEHIVRYSSAASLVEGKIVLDIASGSGYGTQIIARNAKKVYGVDVSEESIKYAKEYFNAENIEYLEGDGERIPLKEGSVDVVVSFETIEHIKNYKKFLKEVKRVLKKDGLLVLSTPNDLEFAEGNHFHLHEFTLDELEDLTKQYFKNNISYFQGTWVYTGLLDQTLISKEGRMNVETYNHAPLKPENYLYFFILCSDRQITEKVTNVGSLSEHWSARNLQEKEGLTNQHIKNISDQLEGTLQHAKEQGDVIKAKDDHIRTLETELEDIKNSKIWQAKEKAKRLKRKLKRS